MGSMVKSQTCTESDRKSSCVTKDTDFKGCESLVGG